MAKTEVKLRKSSRNGASGPKAIDIGDSVYVIFYSPQELSAGWLRVSEGKGQKRLVLQKDSRVSLESARQKASAICLLAGSREPTPSKRTSSYRVHTSGSITTIENVSLLNGD